jgi:hypothetical protein
LVGLPRLLSRQLVIQLVFEVDLSGWLSDPAVEGVEQRSVFLLDRVDLLLASDIVVFVEVAVEMSFELLVSNKSMAAVGTLELNALVEFGDGDDVESVKRMSQSEGELTL